MPKEIVDSKHYGQTARVIQDDGTSRDTGVPVETTHLHIGWTKRQNHVEVGVVNDMADVEHHPGWFVQLDREGCNRAIRLLREARDQGFGRDA